MFLHLKLTIMVPEAREAETLAPYEVMHLIWHW